MNDDYLTIGQMAELNHVSSQTLRLYDKKGLLSPAYQGESNGYRYYHVDQCERLDFTYHEALRYESRTDQAASQRGFSG